MKYLAQLRQSKGLTQAELAERAGLNVNSLARYERGEVIPSITIAHTIAAALHVTEAELLNGPASNEVRIHFSWEVEKDMTLMDIKAGDYGFNFGYRASDNALLLAGAIPFDKPLDDILARIRLELEAAKAGKEARDKALKKND